MSEQQLLRMAERCLAILRHAEEVAGVFDQLHLRVLDRLGE